MIEKYTKDFVNTAFAGKNLEHFERTEYWVRELCSNPDKALLIAAYAHDISRAFNKTEQINILDEKYLENHQKEGGQLMFACIISKGGGQELAARVQYLISKHEVGGDYDSDILKDADSISYFETDAEKQADWPTTKGIPKETIKKKFEWMFSRITSQKAKDIAFPMYERAMKLLERN